MSEPDLARYFTEALRNANVVLDESLPPDVAPRTIRKIGHVVQVSDELAMDYGVIPDTREPVKVSRRQRLRWRWQEKRYAARMRLASWVAGFDVTERD